MFLIEQSSSFRLWTSRALMVYFRRALLFLVVSPRQNSLSHRFLLGKQSEQKICFSDAEDDEETMINRKSEMKLSFINQQENSLKQINQSREYPMRNSSAKNQSDQSLVIVDLPEEQLKPSSSNIQIAMANHALQYYRSEPSSHSQNYSAFNPMVDDINRKNKIEHQIHVLDYRSSDSAISSSSSDDIYEKYQTSFSHILHPAKSHLLEPDTSIITVGPFSSHSIFTNHVSVRLIAYQTDRIIPHDLQPIGSRKQFVNHRHIPVNINDYHSSR